MPATQFDGPIWTGAAGARSITDPSVKGGMPNSPPFRYSYQPTALLTNNIAVTQETSGAFVLAAGTGVTTTTINGVSYIDLASGVALPFGERNLVFSGTVSATTALLTVSGLDGWLRPLRETATSPFSANTTSTVKTFRFVQAIASTVSAVGSCSVGTGDRLGFPYRVNNPSEVQISFANVWITASTGFVAADTATPTALTGPVRGAYNLQTASDGTRRFTAIIWSADVDTNDGLYGRTQFSG
jgi:hypothetical protein